MQKQNIREKAKTEYNDSCGSKRANSAVIESTPWNGETDDLEKMLIIHFFS